MTYSQREKPSELLTYFKACISAAIFVAKRIMLLVAVFGAMPAHAQLLPDPTAREEIRRRQQQEEEESRQRQEAPDVRLREERPEETFELPRETPCFPVHTILLEGDRSGRFSWLRDDVASYIGKCIGREGINLIVKRLMTRLIDRGYVTTRVGVPEQDISTGVLKLVVVPGTISNVRFADANARGTWKTAFPARPGDLLNLRDLEQGLEQMKRVPYQDVDLQIKPGEQPGESDILLSVERQKPWRLGLTLDDAGYPQTGTLQATATLAWDNPLGANDLFYFSWNHDAADRGTERATRGESVYYSMPYGYWTVTAQAGISEYKQTAQGVTGPLQYEGTTRSAEAVILRNLWRGARSRTGLQFRLAKRKSRTWLNDTEILIQRRDQTDAEIGMVHRQYLGRAVLDGYAGYRRGVPWLNAQPDPAAGSGDATTRYDIGVLDASVAVPFELASLPVNYRGRVRAQYTPDTLLTADQFSIGNRYTVRGFDGDFTVIAERGWYVRNELGTPVFRTPQELYVGVDVGAVKGPSDELLPGRTLIGSVLGLRGRYKRLSYDAFSGWPLYKPDGFRTGRPATGFQVNLEF